MRKIIPKDKKGAGLVTGLVLGIVALIVGVIIGYVIITTLNDASLLTTGSVEANASTDLSGNLTAGVNNVAAKIPTILLIAAVVLLFGVLVILMARARGMGIGGGGSL